MIELKNISYEVYDEKINANKPILRNINISFKENKLTVITGHNGSGKSTLIKLIMGINAPSAGRIFYNGQDITNYDISKRANMGFTIAFQQPVKFKGLTVKTLLNLACVKNNNLSDACNYLSKVGLCAKDYLNREANETLSGGELKRIELALSLAKGGEVFLFDEPEAGIDIWSFDSLVKLFKELRNRTVIIVSHQQRIMEIADEIVLLDSDNSPVVGTKSQILPRLEKQAKCNRLAEGVIE